jgi:DNA-binding CsgD family transcriptional regulator
MLRGRDQERAQIDALLDAAREGRSGTLVLRGDAGIGKSALLASAIEHADGLRVLRALGVESESELAFSALHELVRPILQFVDVLPTVQRDALRGALALGPPGQVDRFAVYAATLGLLAEAATEQPLLCIIDDAQWLDTASAEALVFTARRLEAEGIAMLFAVREGEADGFAAPGLLDVIVEGLDRDTAAALLADTSGRAISPEVAERLVRETGGNPLALLELPGALRAAQLSGEEPIVGPLPTGRGVERAFRRRIQALPSDVQRALLVCAASDTGDVRVVTPAASALGVPESAFDEADSAGLLTVEEDGLAFRHPLIRSAAYHGASSAERRQVHRALASVLTGADVADRRAWHLASAALGPDEAVAAALEQAAASSRRRGGLAAEARLLEHAAKLSPDDRLRARRLLGAGRAAWLAGRSGHALALLDESLILEADERRRGEIQLLRAYLLDWRADARAAHELYLSEASRLEQLDPPMAIRMLRGAANWHFLHFEMDDALALAEQAYALVPEGDEQAELFAGDLLALARLLSGRPGAIELARRSAELSQKHGDRIVAAGSARALLWAGEYGLARELLRRSIDEHRGIGDLTRLAYALDVQAELDRRSGRLQAAYVVALESAGIAEHAEQRLQLGLTLTTLTQIEAMLGRADDCRLHAAEARKLPLTPWQEVALEAALGHLELSTGRLPVAIEHLGRVSATMNHTALREPGFLQWEPDLIEALVRCGETDRAHQELAVFAAAAEASGGAWALAAAARCDGLLADDDQFEAVFERALVLHDGLDAPFERARTELCFGERLRRLRRRIEARERLRTALEVFERAGTAGWADRARQELAATGEHARRRDGGATDQLTPQELQIALLVAEGHTNREAGSKLFLSPKTIESHLGRIYRKLGVASRVELARHVLSEGVAEPV